VPTHQLIKTLYRNTSLKGRCERIAKLLQQSVRVIACR